MIMSRLPACGISAQRAVRRDVIMMVRPERSVSYSPMGAYSNQSKSATVVLGAPLLVA